VLVETGGVTVSVIEAERTEPAETPTRIPMSREEFYNLPEGPPFYEWCNGEAIEMNQPISDHQIVVGNIYDILRHAFEHTPLEVLLSFTLDMPHSIRVPDICVAPALEPGTARLNTPPIIAVEILSPSTRHTDLVDKAAEYAEFGIRHYWIVDLEQPSIIVQQNVDGKWIITALLTYKYPSTDVDVSGYGAVTLDLNKFLRNKYSPAVRAAEPVRTVPNRIPMSREEYYNLPEWPPSWEWCHGEAIERVPPTLDHQFVLVKILTILCSAFENSDLEALFGLAFDMPNSVRVADVCLLPILESDDAPPTEPPIIAVEVLSPSTRQTDLVDKAAEYAEFGVEQYWVVDLDVPSITVQQNVDGNWVTIAKLTRENPTSVVEVPGHGTVALDLKQIMRS